MTEFNTLIFDVAMLVSALGWLKLVLYARDNCYHISNVKLEVRDIRDTK